MANILKKAAANLLEKMFTSAEVIAVRAWQPATMFEVDVHLPSVNMEKWNTIRRVKCKVDLLEYRDYTPGVWNTETSIFTMFIDAGHNGAGSRWVRQLKAGDEILLGAVHAAQLPSKEGKILCIGDGSALGHFLALKQLTDRHSHPMEAGIFLHDHYESPGSLLTDNPEFDFLVHPHGNSLATLEQWMLAKEPERYTSIYISGEIPVVTALRKKLKSLPGLNARIYSYGFWS